MKTNRKIIFIIVLTLVSSMFLVACGNDTEPAGESSAPKSGQDAETYTSEEEKFVTLNGELQPLEEPVFLTSIGQSADVSMLDALMNKIGAEYEFEATADASNLSNAKTVILATGASSKGLGAAGISAEDEKARAEEILETCESKGITIVAAHLGGVSRRGKLSDEFIDMVLEYADSIIVVEEGNDDGKFSNFAEKENIPIILVNTIADCIEPLEIMFGN